MDVELGCFPVFEPQPTEKIRPLVRKGLHILGNWIITVKFENLFVENQRVKRFPL